MSRCGLSISSLALVCNSKPIHWKTITDRTPISTTGNVESSGGKNPLRLPWALPWIIVMITTTAKSAIRANLTMAPRLGTHFM